MTIEELKQKVLEAIMCGPLSEVRERIDKVFEEYVPDSETFTYSDQQHINLEHDHKIMREALEWFLMSPLCSAHAQAALDKMVVK